MNSRTSQIHTLTTISLDNSSVLQVGDSQKLDALSYILAVQRDRAIFFENEFLFRNYAPFSAPIPLPAVSEPVTIMTFHENPLIRVDNVNVSFAAASAVIHIGSSESVELETRLKNIRHLVREMR